MKYAIIRLGGKQYKVEENELIQVERQESVSLEVLLYSDGKEIMVGTPVLSEVTVEAVIEANKLAKKVRVYRFKAKSRYRKNKGFRQPISLIRIGSIYVGEKKEVLVKESEAKKVVVPKVALKSATKIEKKTVKTAVKTAEKKLTSASSKVSKKEATAK